MTTIRDSRDSKDIAGRSISPMWFGIVGVPCAVILSLCLGCHRKAPNPPDLTACTRLDVRYFGGALNHFFPDSPSQETVLNEAERARVRSYDTWTVTDQEQINAFARLISQGTYRGDLRGNTDAEAIITGYRGSRRQVKFAMRYTDICTDRKIVFGYHPDFLSLSLASFDHPELQSLRIRWKCWRNLDSLFANLMLGVPRGHHPYPDPNHWCDTIAARIRKQNTGKDKLDNETDRMSHDAAIARWFICPSAHPSFKADEAHSEARETDSSSQTPDTQISTYAMNPNCSEGSPDDMVFLFESKPGWNQHGGPELFTFDNHDPKGGLVFLNDGTAKFIRTEVELKQLRWK